MRRAASTTASEGVDYTAMAPPDLDISGTTANTYTVNGVAATVGQFEAAVDSAVLNGGTVSVSKVGTALVWDITS